MTNGKLCVEEKVLTLLRILLALLLTLIATIIVLAAVGVAVGRDLGQYSHVSADVRACFKTLRDKGGYSCCDTADGTRLEDPDWRADDGGGHSVRLEDGNWHKVPPSADIVGVAKPCVNYSIVWRMNGRIVCFLPGAGT